MTDPNPLDYDRAAARLTRIMAVIAAIGTLGALLGWGWKAGAGFLVGAILSALNFLALKRLIDRLADANPRGRPILLGFRYLILCGIAYVILKCSPISLPAMLAGAFVFTAAVFVEVAIEIVYARK
jgi:hypothetical protein